MITFSQQIDIVSDLWSIFSGESRFVSNEMLKRYKIFLSSSKYERLTIPDFKLTILYIIMNYNPRTKIDLLINLNEFNDNIEVRKLKQEIASKDWLMKQEEQKLAELSNPYYSYKKKELSIFSTQKYYESNPELVKGRIMERDIKKINTFVKLFEEK